MGSPCQQKPLLSRCVEPTQRAAEGTKGTRKTHRTQAQKSGCWEAWKTLASRVAAWTGVLDFTSSDPEGLGPETVSHRPSWTAAPPGEGSKRLSGCRSLSLQRRVCNEPWNCCTGTFLWTSHPTRVGCWQTQRMPRRARCSSWCVKGCPARAAQKEQSGFPRTSRAHLLHDRSCTAVCPWGPLGLLQRRTSHMRGFVSAATARLAWQACRCLRSSPAPCAEHVLL